MSTWERQRVRDVLVERKITVRQVARDLGREHEYAHLANICNGRTVPSDADRKLLSRYLDLPVEELFSEDVLAERFGGSVNGGGRREAT